MECHTFRLKCPRRISKFMNDIFNKCSKFSIVYIDDKLRSINQHRKHLNIFLNIIRKVGIAVAAKGLNSLFPKSDLGHHIHTRTIILFNRAIIFVTNFR